MSITNFSIEYDAINSKNIFTNGDTINGRIIVEASMETKVQTLTFIASGRAVTYWSQGDTKAHGIEIFYEIMEHILSDQRNDGSVIISKGRHVFPFSFQIPDIKMASSYKDSYCSIIHMVEAKLKQPRRRTYDVKRHFNFVSPTNLSIRGLTQPQCGCVNSTIRFFGSGSVTLKVHTERMGYIQGEGITVIVEINNNSSRLVKPKVVFYKAKVYSAPGAGLVLTDDVLRIRLDTVPSGSKKAVKMVINTSNELPSSITNCPIFQLVYRLKVSLRIKYAKNLKIVLPIVVMPRENILDQLHALPRPPTGNSNQVNACPSLPSIPNPVDSPPAYSASSS